MDDKIFEFLGKIIRIWISTLVDFLENQLRQLEILSFSFYNCSYTVINLVSSVSAVLYGLI